LNPYGQNIDHLQELVTSYSGLYSLGVGPACLLFRIVPYCCQLCLRSTCNYNWFSSGLFASGPCGKIGSDRAVSSLIITQPSFGIHGSYIPAISNIIQLIGWTTFEIMIMLKASEMLLGNRIPYYIWTIIIGAFVKVQGICLAYSDRLL
jgi:hypothetical protein